MKVIQVHNYYRFLGGEDIMYEAIVRMLRMNGHNVCMFQRNSADISGLRGRIKACLNGVYSSSTKRDIAAVLALERPDIVHVHNIHPLISPSALVACREHGVPVVLTCHNYRLICPIGVLFNGTEVCRRCSHGREYWCVLKNCRGKIYESVAYALRNAVARKLHLLTNNVTLFVTPSKLVKSELTDTGFSEERIAVIPNLVRTPEHRVDSSGGSYVAFAGRISLEKGVGTLLQAAQGTDLPVRFAGDYSLVPKVVKSVPQNVQFMGLLNQDKLASFYQNARFSVVPSMSFEAFGLVATEAMSHGLPVIASRMGGLAEIVDHGVTGFLFDPGNVADLAAKMKLLWDNPDLCRKMGRAAREKVGREYTEDVYYRRLMAAYERAIELNRETCTTRN